MIEVHSGVFAKALWFRKTSIVSCKATIIKKAASIFDMGLAKELQYVFEEVFLGALDSAEGIGIFLGLFTGLVYDLGLMLLLGVSLVVFRAIILAMIPFIILHSSFFLDIINFLIYFFNFFIDACITVVDAIILVVEAFGGVSSVNWIQWIQLKTVSKNSFKRFLTSVSSSCGRFESAWEILTFVFGETIGPSTCPAVRFLAPLPIFEHAASRFLGWTYCGGALPLTDVSGENCGGCSATTGDYVCVSLGVGYIILELLVPVFIFSVFLFSMRNGIWHLFEALFYGTYFMFEFMIESVSLLYKVTRI